MRIGYVTSHINKSLQWLWFSEGLVDREIDHIHIIINPFKPLLFDDLKDIGVTVYYLPHKNVFSHFKNFFRCRKLLKQHKVDIVHTELPYGNLIGLLSAMSVGISQRITTCENTTWAKDYKSFKQNFIDKVTYKIAKHIVALTDLSKEKLIDLHAINEKKITVIPHCIKISDYDSITEDRINKLRVDFGLASSDFILGMVARYEEWKGHLYAIKAVKELVKTYPTLKLCIAGATGGEYYDQCVSLAKELNIQGNIIFCGSVSDNIALYKLFDIHIHIPINAYVETFGITILEGMASGCVQILTKSGIALYSAIDKNNALVVNYKDYNSVTSAIKMLIENRILRDELKINAKRDAYLNFDYKTKINKHLNLYNLS